MATEDDGWNNIMRETDDMSPSPQAAYVALYDALVGYIRMLEDLKHDFSTEEMQGTAEQIRAVEEDLDRYRHTLKEFDDEWNVDPTLGGLIRRATDG